MTTRLESVRQEVKTLHDTSKDDCMRLWFYEGHVALVANFAEEIAQKVNANAEIAILGGLLHDIARTWEIDDDPALMEASLTKTEELMKKHGYSSDEIEQVKQVILSHSCRKTPPPTLEGKVMATADALAHLLSDFYFILPFRGWLKASDNFEGYKNWLLEKIDRDFHKKIFFEEYQEKAKPKYEALKTVFTYTI